MMSKNTVSIPKSFAETIITLCGPRGSAWLASLPSRVTLLAQQWGLENLVLAPKLSFHYVLFGVRTSDKKPIVLKLRISQQNVAREAKALIHFDGHGSVRLLDIDYDQGALLLEKVAPGKPLATLFPQHDAVAVEHAAEVMCRLHSTFPSDTASFPTIDDWLQALNKKHDGLPEQQRLKAKTMAEKLLATQSKPVLLHGDLHHHNILLSDQFGWLAIDPKGVIGEPAYEVGAYIRNPMPILLLQPDPALLIIRRLELFSQHLGCNKQRLTEWSYVQAVLAACWATRDGLVVDAKQWFDVAEIFTTIMG